MGEEKYIPTGSFCNQGLIAFKQYIENGILDEATVTKDFALNERQIPRLKAELEAAGMLGLPAAPSATAESKPATPESKATKPLAPKAE